MDFSEAERSGFILGFIEFWMTHGDNTHTISELQSAAETLLCGCSEHFRSGVTRISKISAVVPAGKGEAFKSRALALLDAPDTDQFLLRAALISRDFPLTAPWLNWWM
jgi:hypothetical protein